MGDTVEVLKELATLVRNAKDIGENTAERVGRILIGILENLGLVSEDIYDMFLRKDQPDQTDFLIKFLRGVEFGKFKSGLLGTGAAVHIDDDGNSFAEFDYITVRKLALFFEILVQQMRYVGGAFIVSPAGNTISKIEEFDTYYRCYFDTADSKIKNQFAVNDLVRRQTFNLNNQAYYWRLVESVGDDYIDLSKTVYDVGSTAPQVGDDIVQLGNTTDVTRQSAIIISAYGSDSPSIKYYHGINSFTLVDREIKSDYFDSVTGRFVSITYGDTYIGDHDRTSYIEFNQDTGLKVKGAVDVQPGSVGWKNFTGLSDSIQVAVDAAGNALDKANQAQTDAEDAKQDAEDAKQDATDAAGRLDEWASDSVISPAEKLALKQELANLQSEYDTNIANAGKYGLSTTAYTNAWNAYKTELEYHSADTPENITIRPAFKTTQTAFYSERETLLTSIAAAAKEYADKLLESLSVGAENLLLNTGFTGNYKVATLSASTKLSADTSLYSDKLEHWTGTGSVVADTNSMSGYACQIDSLAQSVVLISGESYVISYKAKGTSVNVSCGGYTGADSLTSAYKTYTHKFTYQGGGIFMISGSATVCEIKLERGTVRTDWCPSRKDSSPVADEFKHLWYLQDALKGSTQMIGGLTLTTMIQLGQFVEGVMKKVNAGISGIWNDDRDVAYWAGGTFEQAIATIQKVIGGENPTDAEWKNLAKFVVTHGGDLVLRGLIYATGGIFDNIIINSARSHDNSFVISKDGVIVTGDIQTGVDGERIVLSAKDKSLTMYSADNIEIASLKFAVGESGGKIARFQLQYFTSAGKMGEVEIGSYYLQVGNVVGGVTRRLFISAAQLSYWDGPQEYRGYTGQDGDKYYINGLLFTKVTQ